MNDDRLLEIERKFLVERAGFELCGYERRDITQAYISTAPVLRLRSDGFAYYLSVKSPSDTSIYMKEYELALTAAQFTELWKKIETPAVIKTRYYIPLCGGLIAEFDIYGGVLEGLMTVEVEFPDTSAAAAFTPPGWFGAEVTGDYRYSNCSLAVHGLPR